MKEKLIFSTRLCCYLLDNGFNYTERRRDFKNPRNWIYVFEDTPQLLNAMIEFAKVEK